LTLQRRSSANIDTFIRPFIHYVLKQRDLLAPGTS